MITDFEKQVCDAQINFVLGVEPEGPVYDYYGDMYPFAQEIVNRQVELFSKVEKPKAGKMTAKERIVYDNTVRLIGESLAPRRNLFTPNNIPYPILKSNTLELRAIGFCFMAYSTLLRKEESIPVVYGLIVSLQRFIQAVEKMSEFSRIALSDLTKYCRRLVKTWNFSGNNVPPELISSAPYDEYVPKKALKPYDHQIAANKLLYDPVLARSGFIAVYSTATNSGKTFTAVGLAKRVDRLRKLMPKMQFLFSCVVDSVRQKVENLFQACGISYGVGVLKRCDTKGCMNIGKCDKHARSEHFYIQDPVAKEILPNTEAIRNMLLGEGYKIRDQTREKEKSHKIALVDGNTIIRNPGSQFNPNPDFTAIICKPEVAYYFLQQEGKGDTTVLFLDEFTLNATQIDSKELRDHMNVISVAPKWTYLSNANFVGDDRIRAFLDIHNDRFPSSTVVHISSNVVFSCSNLSTFSGKTFLPHMDATTTSQLRKKIQLINENQFKGRMYNPNAIREMYDMAVRLIKWNFDTEEDGEDEKEIDKAISGLPNIDEIFSDVSQLYPDNIRKIAMGILDVIEKLDEDEVSNIFTRLPKPKIPTIDILNLDSSNFPGMNLVGNPDPEEFAMRMFSGLLKTIKDRIGSLDKMIRTYETLTEKWQSEYDSLSAKVTGKSVEILADLADKQEAKMASRPKIGFPDDLQLGTSANLKGKSRNKFRIPLQIQNIDIESMKSEDKILLLYAGVGIYSSREKDRAYLDEVLSLASTGNLEFLISDISYGMDYPFSCVMITKEFSDQRSMNDIYQLICRGGRGRLSNMAQIYMDDACMNRITSVKDETSEIELRNMIEVLRIK